MFSKSTVTMADIKLINADDERVRLTVRGYENPVPLDYKRYERGVIVEIPWNLREDLGSPEFNALKAVLRPAFKGLIQTRTETAPAFRRAAEARKGEDEEAFSRVDSGPHSVTEPW